MTKIAIVGKGTAGCLSYLNVKSQIPEKVDIDWYYTSGVPTSSVGEGTTPNFPKLLTEANTLDLSSDYPAMDARPKVGIEYLNWGKKDFIHPFYSGQHGVHFNASKFQKLVFDSADANKIDKEVAHSDIDADYIIDCTGYPKDLTDYNIPKYISVNAVHVTQCKWPEEPKWEHTKTIARKWGWVFVIPLMSRCSVGYLYNRNISTLDQVKEDVAELIEELKVIPTDKTNSFHFENYVKKELVTERVCYAGNSGFFLEPMEATTLDSVFRVVDWVPNMLFGANKDMYTSVAKGELDLFFKEVEYFIMMHYAAGSRWKNEFWDFAQERGKLALEEAVNDSMFKSLYKDYKDSDTLPNQYFFEYSYRINMEGLGLAA